LNRPIKLVKQRVIGCLFVNTGRRWPWPCPGAAQAASARDG